MFQNTNTQ